ncbi:DUF6255 family natural product biosynthesis protein [Streptomyces sp. NPDC050617]|uniref:DUF6255 family natural product biosynthesis protein n=1 Tax=Streptomyces sp. NPDC050617 TaxID=3154628 RepID=UPI0034333F24
MTLTGRARTATGRMVPQCEHAWPWISDAGMRRCSACGTERAATYEALRFPLGTPAPYAASMPPARPAYAPPAMNSTSTAAWPVSAGHRP